MPLTLSRPEFVPVSRDGKWKLHVHRRNYGDQRELPQLFDMDMDPSESYNQANREPEVLHRMLGIASRFADEINRQKPEALDRAFAAARGD